MGAWNGFATNDRTIEYGLRTTADEARLVERSTGFRRGSRSGSGSEGRRLRELAIELGVVAPHSPVDPDAD
ncbi:MAG: hypothetical protein L3K05_08440 [Thermoplasmata archaeon]|nr:hypothetical protein [Thermoplasmata archaeon]